MSWREQFKPLITAALVSTRGRPEAEIRAALVAAYPLAERRHYPYKVWLDEIKRQRTAYPKSTALPLSPGQLTLFSS